MWLLVVLVPIAGDSMEGVLNGISSKTSVDQSQSAFDLPRSKTAIGFSCKIISRGHKNTKLITELAFSPRIS